MSLYGAMVTCVSVESVNKISQEGAMTALTTLVFFSHRIMNDDTYL